jgi:peptide/nickel transport system permease protein
MLIGGALGIIAGHRGGTIDSIVMRVLDVLLAFPPLILAILLSEYLGPSEVHVIWAIAYFSVPAFARLSRAGTLRVREQMFMAAANLAGTGNVRIFRHIVPSVFPSLMTFGFLGVGIAIIVEAALSFLGFGVPQPAPSWGNMIAVGQSWLASDPYLVIIPAAFLFATVVSLNLLSDALRIRWALQ